jgi:hypothetical protein
VGVGDWVNEEFEDEWAERAMAQSCSLPVPNYTMISIQQRFDGTDVHELTRNGSTRFG